jgi:hypothetical protein
MPRIPRYTAQIGIPAQGPGVRGNVQQAGQGYAGIASFGEEVARHALEVNEKIRSAREVDEFATAKTNTQRMFNEFELQAADDPDYRNIHNNFLEWREKVYKQVADGITEPKARDAYKNYFDQEAMTREFVVRKLADKKEVAHMRGNLTANLDEAAKQGDVQWIDDLITGAVAANVIDAHEGAKERIAALQKARMTGAWNLALGSSDYNSSLKVINDYPGLTVAERDKLGGHLKRTFDHREAIAAEELKTKQEQYRNEALASLRQMTLTFDNVMKSPLDAKEKEHWIGLIDKQNKALKEGKKSPFEERDPETYAQVSFLVNTEPDKITKPQIYSYVGKGKNKGFTTEDAERLVARRKANLTTEKPDDPLKADRAKRYHTLLKQAHTNGIFGGKDATDAMHTYGEKANLLDAWILSNPDATDKEVEEYFKVLIEKEKSDFFGKLLDNFFTFGPMYPIVDLAAQGAISAIKKNGETGEESFDPEGAGYDYESAISAGLGRDETGHWPSRNPITGQILKGRKHKTFHLTEKSEAESGYEIHKGKDGKYYSTKKGGLDPETAAAILKEAGGDKVKARKIAKERGYTF